jgi:hypothetical protein
MHFPSRTPSQITAVALLLLCAANLQVFAQLPKAVRVFKNPTVSAAQTAFVSWVMAARKTYGQSLDGALKGAMSGGNLTEANAINAVKAAIDAGNDPPTGDFKTGPATQSKANYDAAIARVRSQYASVLQSAQKSTLASGDLTEANNIQAELNEIMGVAPVAAKVAGDGTTAESSDLVVTGTGYKIATFENDAVSWSNRAYKWANVPAAFNGSRYTRTNGGTIAEITVKAKRDTVVHVMIDIKDPKGKLPNSWNQTKTHFTSTGNSADMCIFEKKLTAGKELKIPQVSWCGTLVLLPAQ